MVEMIRWPCFHNYGPTTKMGRVRDDSERGHFCVFNIARSASELFYVSV
jgi:hypothetical protein